MNPKLRKKLKRLLEEMEDNREEVNNPNSGFYADICKTEAQKTWWRAGAFWALDYYSDEIRSILKEIEE